MAYQKWKTKTVLVGTVKEIANKLSITTNVIEASKLNLTGNKPPIIIIKFETSEMRKNLIRTAKSQKLNANMLSNSGKQKIRSTFVNV